MSIGSVGHNTSLGLVRNLRKLHFRNQLAQRTYSLLANRGRLDSQTVVVVIVYLVNLVFLALPELLSEVKQALQSLAEFQRLHTWHVLHIIEVTYIKSKVHVHLTYARPC